MSNINDNIPSSLDERIKLAQHLAASGDILGRHMKDNPGGILNAMYAAEALGVGLWPMLINMQVIDGRPELSANMMRALVLRAGHRIDIVEHTEKICRLRLVRVDGSSYEASFSIRDAEAAGLMNNAKKHNWKKYGADMLYARATSRLVRRHAPDVLCGDMYVHGEIIGSDDDYTEETDQAVTDIVERANEAATQEDVNALAVEAGKTGVLYAVYQGHSLRTILADRWAAIKNNDASADVATG